MGRRSGAPRVPDISYTLAMRCRRVLTPLVVLCAVMSLPASVVPASPAGDAHPLAPPRAVSRTVASYTAPAPAPHSAAAPEPAPSSTAPQVVDPQVTLGAPKEPWLGDTVRVTVSVDPVLPGAPVSLEVLGAAGWTEEATATLDAVSRARFAWRPASYGPVRLRASLPAGADYAAGLSEVRHVTVNRPNRHRVPYKYAHYLVNVLHEYKLYYYEHGALVRAFVVALGRPGYRTPVGTFRIYGKRKPAAGALGACAMFYRRKGGIAIHGTNQPHLLTRFPRPFSHGCTRMRNDEALWLYARVPKGTTVRNVR